MAKIKLRYKFIEFQEESHELLHEEIWHCINHKYKERLGAVVYCDQFQKWEFQPKNMTGFTSVCLRDIAHFLDQLKDKPNG